MNIVVRLFILYIHRITFSLKINVEISGQRVTSYNINEIDFDVERKKK